MSSLTSRLALLALLPAPLWSVQALAQSRLADAARDREFAMLPALLADSVDVDAYGSDGTQTLLWMIYYQQPDLVQALLAAGADPNRANRYDLTPLALALQLDDIDLVRLLLAAGADPTVQDAAGEPLLFTAVRNGNAAVARQLLGAGVDVNARDSTYRQTALMVAARERQPEIVRLLIDAGADVAVQTPAGEIPEWGRRSASPPSARCRAD